VIVERAARNNADWCDLVCRTNGLATAFDADAWVCLRRSPPFYPDAVTLAPTAGTAWLARIDSTPGCSVKDSFARLDLSGDGFRVLFEATWIHRPPSAGATTWRAVRRPGELRAFAAAHGAGDTFRPALLTDPTTVVVYGDSGGAIGNRSGDVVGFSNFFTTGPDVDRAWAEAVAAVSGAFPGLPLVGYEHGDSLAAALRAGFSPIGPLRVWLR
jgi:hypothetical protein